MRKLTILLIISFVLLSPTLLFAQEEPIELTESTQYFDIKMVRGSQSAFDKAVTYTVQITPKIDSARTQILWDGPTAVDINPRHSEFVDMYRDQTYTIKSKVKAKREGKYEITVNLIAWQHDTNYTNSVSDIITFNENLLAIPIDSSYTYSLIVKYLIIALFGGIAIWLSTIYGKKAIVALKKWLTPPN
jgi:hypothetical protein